MADAAVGPERGYAVLAQGGTLTGVQGTVITRSPLFVAGTSALVLAAFDKLPAEATTHPLIEAEQLVAGEWVALRRTGAGGGSGGPGRGPCTGWNGNYPTPPRHGCGSTTPTGPEAGLRRGGTSDASGGRVIAGPGASRPTGRLA